MADIVEPAGAALRVDRDAHQDDKDIQGGGDDQGNRQDAEHTAVLEFILGGGMGDAFKAD